MSKATYEEILEVLSDGGRVHRHLVSGAAMIFRKGGDGHLAISPGDFARLKFEKKIEFNSIMRQGHPVFHGKVEIWHPSI